MLILTYHGYSKAIFSVMTFFPYSAIRLLKCQSIHSPESDCGKMLPFQPGGLSAFTQQERWIPTPNIGKTTLDIQSYHTAYNANTVSPLFLLHLSMCYQSERMEREEITAGHARSIRAQHAQATFSTKHSCVH